ncbi:MFS transporter [Bordetella genomosp. 13]|uniref:MFS transporter n=1 Tax=Bordetella genomosp. 13 TaxID=463040 RepID=UPI0011A7FF60|nr:MFS transporter [Bordetella genomosp. 13]
MEPSSIAPGGLTGARRKKALLTSALGIAMAIMDGVIAAVALPSIAKDFGVDAASSVWVVNAYQLAVVMALLPFAALGEIVGYRRVYLAGLCLFAVSAVLSATAPNLECLTLARALQGLAAAGVLSVNLALLRYAVPKEQFGRAIGMNATIAALASTAAPIVASFILSVGTWHWLFAIGAPVGMAAAGLGWRSLPYSHQRDVRVDWPSAVFSAATFGGAMLTLVNLSHGLAPAMVAAPLAVALIGGWALVRRLRHDPAPLLPLDLLRIPIFRLSVLTSLCSFGAQMVAFIGLPFYFQLGLGFDAVDAGLMLSPWPLTLACTASLAGRLADRYPAGVLGAIGMSLLCAGMAVLAALPAATSLGSVLTCMALCGFGFGLFQPANNRAMIGAAPQTRSGAASGMLGTARLLGQSAGAALVAYLLHRFGSAGALACVYAAAGFALLAALVSASRLRAGSDN